MVFGFATIPTKCISASCDRITEQCKRFSDENKVVKDVQKNSASFARTRLGNSFVSVGSSRGGRMQESR